MSYLQAATLTPTTVHPSSDILLPDVLSKHKCVTNGGLLRDSTAWLVFDNALIIVNTVSGKIIQSWMPAPERGRIVHVTELHLGKNVEPLLVIGLERSDRGVVAVLSSNTARLLRAIEVPEHITSIHPFSSSVYASLVDGYYLPDFFQDSALAYFSGIIAVGCHGGKVYLINLHLNLEDHLAQSSLWFSTDVSKICLINENSGAEEVQSVGENGQHACVHMTRDCFSRGNFIYQKRSFNPLDVKVTALHLVSQIRCICVGYSFGGFHIYSLCPLMYICSSPLPQHISAVTVTHFAYMEPENDPRSFVYLWVAREKSPLVEESIGSEVKIALYQMIFTDKTPCSHQQGVVYQNLQSCCLRLEYPLISAPSTGASIGSLLKCFTVQHHHQGRGLDDSSDGPGHLLDQTVSVFVWFSGEELFLGLFDINQWYQAQMPNTLHWKRSGKYTGVLGCSYFGVYSLKPLTDLCNMHMKNQQILDVCLSNLLPFNSLSPVPETHTWPTSLSFQLTALSESNIHYCECYGLQKLALYELDLCRGALYAQPERFFNMCMQSELLPQHWEYSSGLIDLNHQRKALLTVMIEWNCPTRVVNTFTESWLSDGGYAPIVTDWLSQKLTELNSEKEALCHGLIEGSTQAVPLSSYWRQLATIINLLEKILSYASVADIEENPGFSSIDELYSKAINQQRVFEVVVFLASHGLASRDGDDAIGRYVAMSKHYDQLRGHEQNMIKLAVDYLCEEVDQPYPPHSLQEFIAVFETSNVLAQHCLMLYLLCDLQQSASERQPDLLVHYCDMHSLPPYCDMFVYTLWLLDNKGYHKLEKFMLQIPKEVTPTFGWYHGVVVNGLLRDGKNRLALCYIHNFGVQMQLMDEVTAKISVFVHNQKLYAAHELMLQYEGSEIFEDLFNHFLLVNYEAKSLHNIIDLPLTEMEEELFIAYLNQHQNLTVREILIFYFLCQRRFVEAMAVHEEIKLLNKNNMDPKTTQKCLQRETILRGFIAAIPKILDKRTAQHEGLSDGTRVVSETTVGSLSSVVAKAAAHEARVGSHAGLIYNTLQFIAKSRTTHEVPLTPFRKQGSVVKEKTTVPFLSTPVSVKKARGTSHESFNFASSHMLAPSSFTVHTPHALEGTPFASFQAHMLSFRDRVASMFDQSSETTAIDVSDIHSPSMVTSSLLTKPCLSIATPPSILKRSLSTKQSGTERKKIRFATESPLVTPFHERANQGKLPPRYTPRTSSSLITASSTSLAASTPLPISDDSDQFESPAESPSQLEEYSLHTASKPPRFQLDEDINNSQGNPPTSEGFTAEQITDNFGDEKEDSHRTVEQSFDDDEHDDVVNNNAVPTSKCTSPPLKGLMEKLTRDTIESRESLQITPLKSQSTDKTFAKPNKVSNPSSTLIEPTRLFSPIPMLSELVETKKEKLMKSLDEAKRRHTSVTLHKREPQGYFSPTMVKHSTDSEISTTSSTLHGKQYSFSPPTELHIHPKSTQSTNEFDDTAPFVFSPPLTRSAARRMKDKDADTSMTTGNHASTRKKGQGRIIQQSGLSTPLQDTNVVALISPPSKPTTPAREEAGRVKRAKSVKSGVQTRRSARLLTGKK